MALKTTFLKGSVRPYWLAPTFLSILIHTPLTQTHHLPHPSAHLLYSFPPKGLCTHFFFSLEGSFSLSLPK